MFGNYFVITTFIQCYFEINPLLGVTEQRICMFNLNTFECLIGCLILHQSLKFI